MKLTIFGTGYVGLVTGACLAQVGNHVLCVDVDQDKIERLTQGEIPIYEPGLEALVQNNTQQGRLQFSLDAAAGIDHGNIIMIAVGTPPDEDGSADLSYVLAVARSIGEHMHQRRTVIVKSTVPVGTCDKVKAEISQALAARGEDIPFDVVSNPEFLKEGAAIDDFMRPDRIVCGTDSEFSKEQMRRLYSPFSRNHDKLILMDVRSSELTKYAANALLATKISFMNELANVANRLGADIEKVRDGIGSDPRIGYHFIYAGAGFGGSCFPKDVRALRQTARQCGYEPQLLDAVEAVNDRQKTRLFAMLSEALQGQIAGRTIALWGLAFKPNTDDMREAPSRVFMESVWAAGGRIRAYDPAARDEAQRIYGERDDLTLTDSATEATEGADALAIITEWPEFRSPNFAQLRERLGERLLVDGRNLYDPEEPRRHELHYVAIGRPAPDS